MRDGREQDRGEGAAGAGGWKPVLGLSDEPGGQAEAAARWAGSCAGNGLRSAGAGGTDGAYGDCSGAERRGLPGRVPSVAGEPVGGDFRTGQGLGTDGGGRPLDRPDGGDCARLCRGDGDGGGQAGTGLDGEGERHLDGGEAGAGAMAAVYRRGYDSRAGRPAPGDA